MQGKKLVTKAVPDEVTGAAMRAVPNRGYRDRGRRRKGGETIHDRF